MSAFEILCTTMHQTDLSKVREMNIHSDVVFANQADRTELTEEMIDGHRVRMITTQTRGVGKNRNLAMTYAEGDICLLADDDVVYYDDMEQRVLSEFAAHPDADVIIFQFETDCAERQQKSYAKTKKVHWWNRLTWSTVRIAFRLNSVKKANLWFNTLFGGGCIFPCGEDSMWLYDAKKSGLRFYVSNQTIGTVTYETSTWFTGYDEKYFYGNGAFRRAQHPRTYRLWKYYALVRFRNFGTLSLRERAQWYTHGTHGYAQNLSFRDYCEQLKEK